MITYLLSFFCLSRLYIINLSILACERDIRVLLILIWLKWKIFRIPNSVNFYSRKNNMVFVALILFVLVLLIVLGYKNSISNYIKFIKTYGSVPCPPNRLPLLGNLFNLPLNPYRKEWNEVTVSWNFLLEFSQRLTSFYEQSKNTDLYCLWLGMHPVLAFFHPVGLEVRFFWFSVSIHHSLILAFFRWFKTHHKIIGICVSLAMA